MEATLDQMAERTKPKPLKPTLGSISRKVVGSGMLAFPQQDLGLSESGPG